VVPAAGAVLLSAAPGWFWLAFIAVAAALRWPVPSRFVPFRQPDPAAADDGAIAPAQADGTEHPLKRLALVGMTLGLLVASTVTAVAGSAAPPAPTPGAASAATLAARSAAGLVASRPATLHASPDDAFTQHPVIASREGLQYVPYERTYRGLPVVGGDFVVVTGADGQVLSTSIGRSGTVALASTAPVLTARQAADIALHRKHDGVVDGATDGHLVVFALGASPRLAFESIVSGHTAAVPSRLHVFVDAVTGAVLHTVDEVSDGVGNAAINGGTVAIATTGSGSSFSLTDPTRSGISCRNETGGAVLTGTDDVWGSGAGTDIETGCVDALYGVQHQWDMLSAWLGRNGINGNGGGFPVFVGLNDLNAFWNGSQVHIGHNQAGAWISSMDVVGHEFGHAIDSTTPGGQSATGVSEATGDIFGALTEWFTNNTAFDPPDFSVGEEVNLTGSGPIRQMFDPSLVGDPACYTDSIPTSETHRAAGPFDHWFVLAAQGSAASGGLPASPTCNGTSVTGVGIQTAGRVFYNAMLSKTAGMTYQSYRTATLAAAKNLFPNDCSVFNTIRAAWDAVSVPAQPADPACIGHALFVRDDGLFAVGNVSNGGFVLTQQGTNASPNWNHVVPVGNDVLFVRNDGLFAVGRISNGRFARTQQGTNAALNWTHVVAVGNDVLFVRNDGLFAVGRVSNGRFDMTQQGTGAAPNWTHVVAVGNDILFVRNDGLFAVGHISNGGFVMTQSATNAAPNWNHVVAVGNDALFVRNDGLFAVGHVSNGGFVLTQQGTNASPNWTHVVAVGNDVLWVRNDGLFAVGHISNGGFVQTQQGTNAAPNWTHVVAVGNDVLWVRNDGLFAVGHISNGGFVMTQSATNAAPNWTHVVAVV
jgi:Zn-dependent metalloprotease